MAENYNVLITYDVHSEQEKVKHAMVAKGYMKGWTDDGVTYHLPETTLWKKSITTKIALADLNSVCTSLQVRLIRAVAVPANPWSAIPGKDF